MKWGLSLSFLLPFVAATFPGPPYKRYEPRAGAIEWGPCPNAPSDHYQCGIFDVPLDWAKNSSGKASLAVVTYPATKSPRKGALLTNPGGPGGSGVDFVLGFGKNISDLTEGHYDIVSWDPRGVGYTTPGLINCFTSLEEWAKFWNGTVVYPRIDIKYGFEDQADYKYFESQVPVMESRLQSLKEVCLKGPSAEWLQYVGTTATVRDLVAIAEYFDGPGCDINYWGFSYGTTIGNYLINMFPSRVGKVILDGVEDPVTHANQPSHLYWAHRVESVDETYQGFAEGCALAGPKGCPLSTKTSTAGGIINWTRQLVELAHDYARSSGIDDFKGVNLIGAIHQALYTPSSWADFASNTFLQFYQDLIQASGANLPLSARSLSTLPARQSSQDFPDYTFHAITCGDSVDQDNVTTQAVFDELARVVKDVSPMFGGQFPQPAHHCHRWATRAVERFTGPWNHTLKNPIIVIGNKADPATPFLDASVVAGYLGKSAILVEQDGLGHVSIAEKSSCTQNIVTNFFVNGVLPKANGTNAIQCALDANDPPLFPSGGVSASDIRNALSNGADNNGDGSGSSSDQVASLKTQNRNLNIAVIALAAACGCLLVSLIVQTILGRRRRGYAAIGSKGARGQKVEFTGFDGERAYSDPYDSTKR